MIRAASVHVDQELRHRSSDKLTTAAAAILLVDPELWPYKEDLFWRAGGGSRKTDIARATAMLMLEWERLDGIGVDR